MSEETTFTPGPWRQRGQKVVAGVNGELIVAKVPTIDIGEHVNQHCLNARLIAAAPELLEALQEFVTNTGTLTERERRVKAFDAIHKATQPTT